jgi:hypothetical protein
MLKSSNCWNFVGRMMMTTNNVVGGRRREESNPDCRRKLCRRKMEENA